MRVQSAVRLNLYRNLIVSLCVVVQLVGALQGQGLETLDAVVRAHGADLLAPVSVRMRGTVERNQKTEAFQLLATRDEKVRIEYGTDGKDTIVASTTLNFRDDGQKFDYSRVPTDYSQLDITGLFFLQQLRQRAVRIEPTNERGTVDGVVGQKIRMESERSQRHYGKFPVNDRSDFFVMENGLLLAVYRSFYEGRPERYTQTYIFSDYKKVDGVLLPYRIDKYIKSRKLETYTIQSYEFNVATEREQFSPRRAK